MLMITKVFQRMTGKKKSKLLFFSYGLLLLSLNACSNTQNPPQNSMRLTADRVARQAIQTRDYDGIDQAGIIRAVMNIIQDQHYTIREVNADIGTVYADQTYDMGRPISFFGIPLAHFHQKPWEAPALNIEMGPLAFGGMENNIYLAKKNSSISVVVTPSHDQQSYRVRASIEVRTFYNNGQIGDIWLIKDPNVYQKFFASLSQAIYLQQANH